MQPILKKCIDELGSTTPRIDYVLGMLETLYSMQVPSTSLSTQPLSQRGTGSTDVEGSILDARARAAMSTIKDMESQILTEHA